MVRKSMIVAVAALGSWVGGCSDDETTTDSSTTTASGSGGTAGQGGTGGTGGTAGQGGTGGTGGTGGAYVYAPPDLQGRVFVGHYLGDYDVVGVGSSSLTPTAGSPVQPGAPGGDLLGIPKHDAVVLTMEGGTTIQAYDASSLTALAGSPYTTGYGPTALAHDDARDRLYVYCIGTVGEPEESLLSVFDTSSVPWTEVSGSPFDIDVPAHAIEVDPVTGQVYGLSLSTVWAVRIDGTTVAHLTGSPRSLDDSGADLAIDPARRRLYVTEWAIPGPQKLHGFDIDSFEPLAASPLSVAGTAIGDVVVDPAAGDIYLVEWGTPKLHSATPSPFALRNACSTDGCPVPPTETGLALDHELGRLFIAHVPDSANPDSGPGFLSAWDVSDPANPTEITSSGNRPALATYPNRATAQ